MIPVLLLSPFLIGGYRIDERDYALLADVKEAIRRTKDEFGQPLTMKDISNATGVSVPKLSEQLNGHAPFYSFGRFAKLPGEFWRHFHAIQAERLGDGYITFTELVRLIGRVDILLDVLPTRMVKAEGPGRVTVQLPLTKERHA